MKEEKRTPRARDIFEDADKREKWRVVVVVHIDAKKAGWA